MPTSQNLKSHILEQNQSISPNIEVVIGKRLRRRREVLGLSLGDLSRILGIKSQQLIKYEQGTSRIPASRLGEIANLFGISMNYFFGSEPEPEGEAAVPTSELMARYFEAIPSIEQKRFLVGLAATLARRAARER